SAISKINCWCYGGALVALRLRCALPKTNETAHMAQRLGAKPMEEFVRSKRRWTSFKRRSNGFKTGTTRSTRNGATESIRAGTENLTPFAFLTWSSFSNESIGGTGRRGIKDPAYSGLALGAALSLFYGGRRKEAHPGAN